MRTLIKEKAIISLKRDFYPQDVVESFLSYPQHKRQRNWVKQLNSAQELNCYIRCKDVRFFGNPEKVEKNKRKYFRSCGITVKKMSDFMHLNYLFLLDVYKKAENADLKNYYKALVCLNGGDEKQACVILERRKMEEIVHKLQAKLINTFTTTPPELGDLRNFILISVFFSTGVLLHEESVKENFLQLCKMFD